jgi:hypothetical protein
VDVLEEHVARALLATCCHAGFLLSLFFDPEDGGDMFLLTFNGLYSDISQKTVLCNSAVGLTEHKVMNSPHTKSLILHLYMHSGQSETSAGSAHMCTESHSAKFVHRRLGLKGDFRASSGWKSRFKQYHSIHEIAMQGELLAANAAKT